MSGSSFLGKLQQLCIINLLLFQYKLSSSTDLLSKYGCSQVLEGDCTLRLCLASGLHFSCTVYLFFLFFPLLFKPLKNVRNERSPSLHSCSSGTLPPDSSSSSSTVPSDPYIHHGTTPASSRTGKFQKMLEYPYYCSFKEIMCLFALKVSFFFF